MGGLHVPFAQSSSPWIASALFLSRRGAVSVQQLIARSWWPSRSTVHGHVCGWPLQVRGRRRISRDGSGPRLAYRRVFPQPDRRSYGSCERRSALCPASALSRTLQPGLLASTSQRSDSSGALLPYLVSRGLPGLAAVVSIGSFSWVHKCQVASALADPCDGLLLSVLPIEK